MRNKLNGITLPIAIIGSKHIKNKFVFLNWIKQNCPEVLKQRISINKI